MVQSGTWEWLLQGFKFELETEVKPRTVEYYYKHARLCARWAQNQGLDDPYFITKRHLQAFLYQIVRNSEMWIGGNGAICKAQRSERTRWHYYRALKRFFSWAAKEDYFNQNPLNGIKLKAPKPPPKAYQRYEVLSAYELFTLTLCQLPPDLPSVVVEAVRREGFLFIPQKCPARNMMKI